MTPCIITNLDRFESVIETEDEDTVSRDGKSSVQAVDAIRLERLDIDIDQAIEPSLTALGADFGVVIEPSTGVDPAVYPVPAQLPEAMLLVNLRPVEVSLKAKLSTC